MAGRSKTMKQVLFRVMGVALVFGIAAAPAMATGPGPGTGPGSPLSGGVLIGTDATHMLATLSLPGCGAAADASGTYCGTTARMATEDVSEQVCTSARAYIDYTQGDGTNQSGECRLGWGWRAGRAITTVHVTSCDTVDVWHPVDTDTPAVTLRDASDRSWRLQRFILRARNYQHVGGVDIWTMDEGLLSAGSWAVFTNGSKSLTMWITGTLVASANCAKNVDAASFVMDITSWGLIQRG